MGMVRITLPCFLRSLLVEKLLILYLNRDGYSVRVPLRNIKSMILNDVASRPLGSRPPLRHDPAMAGCDYGNSQAWDVRGIGQHNGDVCINLVSYHIRFTHMF